MIKEFTIRLTLLYLGLIISSCSKESESLPVENQYGTDVLSFKIITSNGLEYYPFLSKNNKLHVKVPNDNVDYSSLKVEIVHNGEKCIVDGREYSSHQNTIDFSNVLHSKSFRIISSHGEEAIWDVFLYNIPVLIIDTPDSAPIISKEERTKGCVVRMVESDTTIIELGTAGIKGRGSSTWAQAKKPYNVKFEKKQSILGMNKSKHWILLANAGFDKTQLHNATAFEMARLTDYPWVQSGDYVELIMNNSPQGLYYLCEKIGIEKNKINIDKMTPEDTDGVALSGGYLLEATLDTNEPNFFYSTVYNQTGYEGWGGGVRSYGWILKDPEDNVPDEQWDYIRKELDHMEKMIVDKDSLLSGVYRKYFDIENMINWYLVEEVTLNEEASRNKNLYMYKKRGGQFVIGPPWDFDAWTFGLYGTGWLFCRQSLYLRSLFQDPFFVQRLKEKWIVIKSVWNKEIPQFIDNKYNYIYHSAKKNEALWPNWSSIYTPESTFESSVDEMKKAFINQMIVVDDFINSL